jgi:Zn-dependent protease with chaperone function
MSKVADKMRSRKEGVYGVMALVIGALLWALIVLGMTAALVAANQNIATMARVYLGYGIAIALFYWISAAAYRATAFGNMILLGPQQFPELHAMVADGARELGMEAIPKAFLFNSHGVVNAFARRLFGGGYVFLTSALVEASSDEQVRFVIGHELGHHAAGHLNPWKNALKFPAYLVPFLQPAYSRAREYTSDCIGAYLSKDLVVSRSALQMLGCGCRRLNTSMNCEAFMAQEAMVPPIMGFLTEICRSHPRLTRRLKALKQQGAVITP